MLRAVLLALVFLCCKAFSPAGASLQLSKSVMSRADLSMMARAGPKRAAAKPKAKSSSSSGKPAQEGKGGIFPWITNKPGTYAKPLLLSSIDFTSDQSDAFIGWGFMPKSVKALYPKGKKGLL